jgi:hypothetical protein
MLYKEAEKFTLTRGAIKAIELMNDESHLNLFKPTKIPVEEILLPYKIFLLLLSKRDLALSKNNNLIWKEVCDIFVNESEGKIGDFIMKSIFSFNFSTENVYCISKILGNDISKMTSNNYSKLCYTTGMLIFCIKDALEYSGVILERKTPLVKFMNLMEYKIECYEVIQNRLSDKVDRE